MDSDKEICDNLNGLYRKLVGAVVDEVQLFKVRIIENQFLRKMCLKFFQVFLCGTAENGAENEWKKKRILRWNLMRNSMGQVADL